MGFSEKLKQNLMEGDSTWGALVNVPVTDNLKHNGYGPGLGLSSTLPVTENVYIIATLSGFYLWGKESGTRYEQVFPQPPDSFYKIATLSRDNKYTEYGINTTIAIGYYIVPASTTISFGQRYQYIKTKYDNNDQINYLNKKNKFYGTTLTATYSFGVYNPL